MPTTPDSQIIPEPEVIVQQFAGSFQHFRDVVADYSFDVSVREVGHIEEISAGIARVSGLPGVQYQELIRFSSGTTAMTFNLEPEAVSAVILEKKESEIAGEKAYRTYRTVDIGVGEALISRVLDPLGRPLDQHGTVKTAHRMPVEKAAPPIMDRSPVTKPVQTGIQVIDALIPIGRGQRELIVGDRQTGKTAIAVDTIINQQDKQMSCIYCAIGQRLSAVARDIQTMRDRGAMDYSIIIVASEEDSPGMRYLAPYAATAVGEYFMERGDDVLIVFDDLTKHARAYREISLLMRRPPAREAYPGDIFYIHSRLLERATHLIDDIGGGSLTALPIVETQAQNVSAYIPTNLISITDGQIYVNPSLFQQGVLPAVDVGKSVSRVGGKTQLAAYRTVAADLRLQYSQFQELEAFSRFGTRLDEETRQTLHRGRRVREIFKQRQYRPIPVDEQIAVLLATSKGVFDAVPLEKLDETRMAVETMMREHFEHLGQTIHQGETLSDEDMNALVKHAQQIVARFVDESDTATDDSLCEEACQSTAPFKGKNASTPRSEKKT